MLNFFRQSLNKWFIKVLLVAIIASFTLWGVSDMVRNYYTTRAVAKVDGKAISYDTFINALQQEINRIQKITQGRINHDQLKAMGIHNHVLAKLINQLALEQELLRLNLMVSDNSLRDQVHEMPIFQNDGQFDKERFKNILNNAHITESDFLKDMRQSMLSSQLIMSLTNGVKFPIYYSQVLYQMLYGKTIFTMVSIPANKIILKRKASLEDTKNFYELNKTDYLVPEYRSITLVILDQKAIDELIKISDEDLKQLFTEKKDAWQIPEKRAVKKLTFNNKEKAEKALVIANNAKSLAVINKEITDGKMEDLGTVTKDMLPDNLVDKIFALEIGQAILHQDGQEYQIFEVSKIVPPAKITFEEAKPELINELRPIKFAKHLEQIRTEIDDLLAAGTPLTEVAKKFNLPISVIDALDKNGLDKNGQLAINCTSNLKEAIINKTFELDKGLDSGFVDVNKEGAFLLQVNSITPSYEPKYEDVEKKVIQKWVQKEQAKESVDLATQILDKSNDLGQLAILANQHQLTLTSNHEVSREQLMKDPTKFDTLGIPLDLLEKILTLPVNKGLVSETNNGAVLLMVQKIIPAEVIAENQKKLSDHLDNSLKADVTESLINALKLLHQVEISQNLINEITN